MSKRLLLLSFSLFLFVFLALNGAASGQINTQPETPQPEVQEEGVQQGQNAQQGGQQAQSNLNARCNACHGDLMTAYADGPHREISCTRCHNQAPQHADAPNQVPPGIDVSATTCGECHQRYYDGWRAIRHEDQTPQKMDEYPLLPKLLSGHPFAKDYREPRQHFNMLDDIKLTTRPGFATCYTCKSADVYHQWGDTITYDSDPKELLDSGVIEHPITCVMCHSPHAGGLRIVQPALKDALAAAPADHPAKDTKLGNNICAQCHVNYNFNPGAKKNVYPFRKVGAMEEYTRENDFWPETKTGGWEHPELGITLYKVQHPESELYWNSTHFNLGVTCTDCHMPKVKDDKGEVYTQHWVTSPLNHLEQACGSCHPNVNHEERIKGIQDELYGLMKTTMDTMSTAIDKIEAARGADQFNQNLLNQANAKYFTAHLNWEWIAAENSMGFHNPGETRQTLTLANDSAQEAITLAERALTDLNAADGTQEQVRGLFSGPTGIALALLLLAAAAGLIYYFMTRRKVD